MDIAKEIRMQSSREYKVNVENVSIHILADYANDFELPAKYRQGFAYHYYKIIAVITGTVYVHFDKIMITLNQNDIILITSGNRYVVHRDNDATVYCCLGLEFANNGLKDCFNYYSRLAKIFAKDYFVFENKKHILDSIQNCFEAVTAENAGAVGVSVHAMINEMTKVDENNQVLSHKEYKSDMSRIHKINMLIHSYYDKEISLADISKLLYLSQSQTNRIIRQHFGMTWRELVIKKRMEVALWHIANRDWSLAEIASFVGYTSERGFYTAFKKYYNKAPGFFRNKHDLVDAMLLAQKTNIVR